MSSQFSIRKAITFLMLTVASLVVAHYTQPLIHGNDAAVNVIVTVFSVLAGFLVAIIAVVGDPALLPPGSWRAAEMDRDRLDRRLVRHQALFMSYLVTLGVIFMSLVVSKSVPSLGAWLERIYLFLGILAFLYSLRLPSVLIATQRERIDSIIESRRKQEGISSGEDNS
jgi:type IV secretory pathway VirB2 component (pilin)